MFQIGDPKENAPGRTTTGRKGYRLPFLSELTAQEVIHQGCEGCAKRDDHSACAHLGYEIPVGEHRHERMPAAQGLTATEAITMRSALWKAHYTANGVVKNVLYNLGSGANNVSQQQTYEIVGASGSTLTLKGRNPKRITHGNSIINPLWPGIDPETGEPEPRLTSTDAAGCLPVGSLVEFAYPSVLQNKLTPCITKINAPSNDDEETTFSVECSHPVSSAKNPYDLKYPPADGKYYCTIYYYFTAPEQHPNYQERQETQFARISKTFNKAAVDAGAVSLTDSDGNATRIILPSMVSIWHEKPVLVALVTDDGRTRQEFPTPITEDTGSGWATTVDLSAYSSATLEEIEVIYWAEAVATDTGRRPFFSSCANSQIDYSGSYIQDSATGRRCVNVDCDQFDSYRGECWKPSASGFNLLTSSKMPITTITDGQWQGRFWEDTTLRLDQGVPGISSSRNFTYSRIGGPSVGELMGYFRDIVPGGKFEARERVHAAAFGQLEEYDPGDGGARLRFIPGAYLAQVEQDATASNKEYGVLTDIIPAWDNRDGEMGDTMTGRLEDYPTGSVGFTNIYNYTQAGRALNVRSRKSPETEERHIVGVKVSSAESAALTDLIRGWF